LLVAPVAPLCLAQLGHRQSAQLAAHPLRRALLCLAGLFLARSESSLPPLRFESCCGSSAGSGVFGLAGCFGAIFLGATLYETAQPEHTTNALKDLGRQGKNQILRFRPVSSVRIRYVCKCENLSVTRSMHFPAICPS
jgi:hypothetical protein